MRARLRLTLLFFVCAASVRAVVDAPSAAGHWEGAIVLPGQQLEVRIDLSPGGGGAWTGAIDIPAQGAKGLALTAIQIDGPSASFMISGVPGNPAFRGTLASDGNAIAGDFTQGGQKFPFRIERKADAARAAAQALDGFGDFVAAALKDWKVPGVAVAIVQDDRVVLSQGYGLRDVSHNLPVTPNTLFAIGSSTKAFTVMALGILADEGKISWDTPVKTYLPSFKLKDAFATDRMTPRDLVTHRSGLPRHDLMWYAAPLSRKQIFDRLQYLEPNADLRAKWQYQNLMFMTAGYLAGEVAGVSWEDLIAQRVFGPLGMTSSNFSVEVSKKSADFALPYTEKDKIVREIPFRNIDQIGPAGSIDSNVVDMARWVRLHLSGGKVGDARLVSETALDEMHRPQMVMTESGRDPEITLPSYAMGWFVESYRGRTRIHHGGNIDGFSAMVTFVPRDGIGVVVLSNLNGTPLPEIICRTAIDRLLGLPPIDWNARLKARADEAEKATDKAKGKSEIFDRKKGTHPAHPLEEYVGDYEHPAYGVVSVARSGDKGLQASIHGIPLTLEHWHYETFRAESTDPALADEKLFVLFQTNTKGDVDGLTLPLEPSTAEIVFAKKPPAQLSDPAFLKTLTGTYALVDEPSVTITIALRGDSALTAHVIHQPQSDLEPYRGTEFKFKGLTGFSIRFVPDAKGAVSELLILQPDGVYAAKRKP